MTKTLLSNNNKRGRILRILAVSICLGHASYHFIPNSIGIPTWYTYGTVERKTTTSLDKTLMAETLVDTIDKPKKQLENTEKKHLIEIEDIKTKVDQELTRKEEIAVKFQKQLEPLETKNKTVEIEIEDIKAKVDQELTRKEEIAVKFQKQLEPLETKDKTVVEQKQPAATKVNKLEILRNPNAMIASDIASIYHFPDQITLLSTFMLRPAVPDPT
jgi:hypothetical protein